MIDRDSRFASCVILVDGSEQSFGARPRIDTTPRPDDLFHTVTDGDRIDNIAYRYFGNSKLWWIIADYNDIFFPLLIPPGSILRIPAPEQVHMRILS